MKKSFLFILITCISILCFSCKTLQPPAFKYVGTTGKFDNGDRFFLILRKNGSASILKQTSEKEVYRYNYTYTINRYEGNCYINLQYTDYDSHNFIKNYGDIDVKYIFRWYIDEVTLIDKYKDDYNKIVFYPNKNYKYIYRIYR